MPPRWSRRDQRFARLPPMARQRTLAMSPVVVWMLVPAYPSGKSARSGPSSARICVLRGGDSGARPRRRKGCGATSLTPTETAKSGVAMNRPRSRLWFQSCNGAADRRPRSQRRSVRCPSELCLGVLPSPVICGSAERWALGSHQCVLARHDRRCADRLALLLDGGVRRRLAGRVLRPRRSEVLEFLTVGVDHRRDRVVRDSCPESVGVRASHARDSGRRRRLAPIVQWLIVPRLDYGSCAAGCEE